MKYGIRDWSFDLEEIYDRAEVLHIIKTQLSLLNARQRLVVERVSDDVTYADISRELGLSKERVRQIYLNKALPRLRRGVREALVSELELKKQKYEACFSGFFDKRAIEAIRREALETSAKRMTEYLRRVNRCAP